MMCTCIYLCIYFVTTVLSSRYNNILSIYNEEESDIINNRQFADNSLWDSVETLSLENTGMVQQKCMKLSKRMYCLCQMEGSLSKYECRRGVSSDAAAKSYIINNYYDYNYYNQHFSFNDNLFNMKMKDEYDSYAPIALPVVPLQIGNDPAVGQNVDSDTTRTIDTLKGEIKTQLGEAAPVKADQRLLAIRDNADFDSDSPVSKDNWHYKGSWLKDNGKTIADYAGDIPDGHYKIYLAGTRAAIKHHTFNNALENTLKQISDDVLLAIDRKVPYEFREAKKKVWNDFKDSFEFKCKDLGINQYTHKMEKTPSFHTCLNNFVFGTANNQDKDGLVTHEGTTTMGNIGVSKESLRYLLNDDNKEGFTDLQSGLYNAIRIFIGKDLVSRGAPEYKALCAHIRLKFNDRSEKITIKIGPISDVDQSQPEKEYGLPEWCDAPVAKYMIEEVWKIRRTHATIKDKMENHDGDTCTPGEKRFYYLSHFGGHILYKFNKIPVILKKIFRLHEAVDKDACKAVTEDDIIE